MEDQHSHWKLKRFSSWLKKPGKQYDSGTYDKTHQATRGGIAIRGNASIERTRQKMQDSRTESSQLNHSIGGGKPVVEGTRSEVNGTSSVTDDVLSSDEMSWIEKQVTHSTAGSAWDHLTERPRLVREVRHNWDSRLEGRKLAKNYMTFIQCPGLPRGELQMLQKGQHLDISTEISEGSEDPWTNTPWVVQTDPSDRPARGHQHTRKRLLTETKSRSSQSIDTMFASSSTTEPPPDTEPDWSSGDTVLEIHFERFPENLQRYVCLFHKCCHDRKFLNVRSHRKRESRSIQPRKKAC